MRQNTLEECRVYPTPGYTTAPHSMKGPEPSRQPGGTRPFDVHLYASCEYIGEQKDPCDVAALMLNFKSKCMFQCI
jgi:hypothetical protein